MAKYDAVDRLMTLATETRADRTPGITPPIAPVTIEAAGGLARARSSTSLPDAPAQNDTTPGEVPVSAAARARQLLEALRPFLPAVAGAMRLVDHGAVQAVAKILPLLGGGAGLAGVLSPKVPSPTGPDPWLSAVDELKNSSRSTRKDLDALTVQVTTAEDQLGRTRNQLERLAAEHTSRESELRSLWDRVRLLSAAVIILLMLIIAQMILLVVMLHR